ncbi:unnamed protein product [Sphenostylis stenocarpa]|uniref:C2 NT-type domain-containing protein n=1 Tax=Sphenostylis stenocarpa TaxID=92480 RepID=A0AA86T3H8_9FABA|nr:unnamed protein product [Sphenostylis stenocarpa]
MSPMKCWATKLSGHSNKHALKVTQLKLDLGLFGATLGAPNDKVAFQITGTATKKEKPSTSSKPKTTPLSFSPFSKRQSSHTTSSRRLISSKSPSLTWDARDLCAFHLLLKDDSLDVCDLALLVLYGEGGGEEAKAKAKMTAVGKAEMSVALAELVGREEKKKTKSSSHNHFQKRLPIKLRVNGICIEATLLVSLRLLKLRDSNSKDDPVLARPFENSAQQEKKHGIIEKVKHLTSLGMKNNDKIDESKQSSPYDSDRSPMLDSDDSSNDSNTSSGRNNNRTHNTQSTFTNGSERLKTSRTKTDLQRNRSTDEWNFKTSIKQQIQTSYPGPFTKSNELFLQVYQKDTSISWEFKEIKCRDGKTKLKTNVFFASFDQMSEKACGESACTVLVALIAHWLHCNDGMPTRVQFEKLITQGSSQWRRLCNNDYYSKLFPDKHFDLETIIDANLRPLIVLPHKSYTGFFSPEKFQCLKGAMSFDEIWDEIKSKVGDHEPRIYIVSWNDHFFVLKVERDAYYIIDSLGERLFEGCQQAFILKFDDSSVIYKKMEKAKEEPSKGIGGGGSEKSDRKSHEIICHGKECCKEFIKRFLAAIPLWQLEKEERKWSVSSPNLHRQLQIDFHYSFSSSSSSSSSSAATSTDSLWSLISSGSLEA